MNPPGNKLFGVATMRNLPRSRSRLILMMYFGVIHVLVMKDGKKWMMACVQYNSKVKNVNIGVKID